MLIDRQVQRLEEGKAKRRKGLAGWDGPDSKDGRAGKTAVTTHDSRGLGTVGRAGGAGKLAAANTVHLWLVRAWVSASDHARPLIGRAFILHFPWAVTHASSILSQCACIIHVATTSRASSTICRLSSAHCVSDCLVVVVFDSSLFDMAV